MCYSNFPNTRGYFSILGPNNKKDFYSKHDTIPTEATSVIPDFTNTEFKFLKNHKYLIILRCDDGGNNIYTLNPNSNYYYATIDVDNSETLTISDFIAVNVNPWTLNIDNTNHTVYKNYKWATILYTIILPIEYQAYIDLQGKLIGDIETLLQNI